MTTKELNYYKAAAQLGLIPDSDNPIFLYSSTPVNLLVQILNGNINAKEFARTELRNRGRDDSGKWVGWHHDARTEPA